MRKKGFVVTVEFNIKSISCPGVWLCTNGKVSLQIYMFDACAQTDNVKPVFPIYCNEKYVFHKTFRDVHRLNELQRALYNEWLYVELIQWQNCDEGCVLGTFQTTLDDLLYPSSIRGSVAGHDLELLMEPTQLFPGKIAPKLHINTKTTISEVLCNVDAKDNASIINPKLLLSSQPTKKTNKARRVCHSLAFSRAKRAPVNQEKLKPPFVCGGKVDDNLILRRNPDVVLKVEHKGRERSGSDAESIQTLWSKPCYCCCSKRGQSVESRLKPSPTKSKPSSPRFPTRPKLQSDHKTHQCSTCSRYELCFSSDATPRNRTPCKYCKENRTRHGSIHIKSRNSSPCDSDVSRRNVCRCIAESATRESKRLVQRLHKKFNDTINHNSRMLRNTCINCDDC